MIHFLRRVPPVHDWPSVLNMKGDELSEQYRRIVEKLGQGKGLPGLIFGLSEMFLSRSSRLFCTDLLRNALLRSCLYAETLIWQSGRSVAQ